jgi:hypothetical protein
MRHCCWPNARDIHARRLRMFLAFIPRPFRNGAGDAKKIPTRNDYRDISQRIGKSEPESAVFNWPSR